MRNKNNKDLNNINLEFLDSIESNNQIFEKKLNNLTNSITTKKKKKPHISNIDKLEKEIFGKSESNKVNNIHLNNLNNFTFKKKESNINEEFNNEEIDELKKEKEKLEKENNYKDYLINDLRNEIKEKNKKEKISHINCNKYNDLKNEMEDKNYYINKLENNINHLKLKIDNLELENQNLIKENIKLNNKLDEYTHESDVNKNNWLNNEHKLKDLQKVNQKLNLEFLNLTKEYNKVKEEKENLQSIIDEQNTIIFYYKKQISYKAIDKILDNKEKYAYDNVFKTFTRNYSQKENNYWNKNKYIRNGKSDNVRYNNFINNNYYGDKYNYYKNDYGDGTLYFITKKNKEVQKSEINYLENYLNSLLNERFNLENELEEIPKNPRTFSDIKYKNNINDKIAQNNNEIKSVKKKLRKIRDY